MQSDDDDDDDAMGSTSRSSIGGSYSSYQHQAPSSSSPIIYFEHQADAMIIQDYDDIYYMMFFRRRRERITKLVLRLAQTTVLAGIFLALFGNDYFNANSVNWDVISSSSSSNTEKILSSGPNVVEVRKSHHHNDTKRISSSRTALILDALHQLESQMEGTVYYFRESATSSSSDNDNNDDFEKAAAVWCAGYDPPLAVVQVASVHDVQRAVPVLANLSKQFYNFNFRIRSGGHHKAGYSTVSSSSSGAVLSLTRLNDIQLLHNNTTTSNTTISNTNTASAIATMGPAVTVGQFVNHVLKPHGYGGVIGFCSGVAEGGFVLGGGIGLQSRLYGLGLDNVVSMKVVLADGSLVVASKFQHPDLFWALRGAGGGSLGVVTELEYRIHRASDRIHTVSVKLALPSDVANFLFRLGELETHHLPGNVLAMHDEIHTINLFWSGQDDKDVEDGKDYLIELVHSILSLSGSLDTANITQIPNQWTLMTEQVGTNDFSWGDMVWKAACWTGFLHPENNTASIWLDIMQYFESGLSDSPHLLPDVELWGGAIHKTRPNATAFPYRSAIYNVGVLLMVPVNELDAETVFQQESDRVNQWWPNVAEYLTGSYVNYPSVSLLKGDDSNHYAQVFWGENLPRLVRVKQRYDPDNVFSFPMSIPLNL